MPTTSEHTQAEHSGPERQSHERKEPLYLFTEKYVADESELARRFIETRARLNENVDKADNFLVKRFYNLDHNTYLDGALPAKTKELMGLVASACLRCDDCISYHVAQCKDVGVTRDEFFEVFSVGLVVGGSIVIPHLRRAVDFLDRLESGDAVAEGENCQDHG